MSTAAFVSSCLFLLLEAPHGHAFVNQHSISLGLSSASDMTLLNARPHAQRPAHARLSSSRRMVSSSTTLDFDDRIPVPLRKLSDPHPLTVVLRELYRMTRPLTIPGEIGLAVGGSLLAAPHLSTLGLPLVWLVALFSGATGAGSMVINDYFDFRAGVDYLKPKPLTLGTVHPEQALLVSCAWYMLSLFFAAVLLQDMVLRALVSSSLLVTFFYTPLLKAIPLVKNGVVAFVISQAIVAGGLATGDAGQLLRTIVPGLYVFCAIMWQEIMMDITDVEGDRRGGIRTLPVIFGPKPALCIALLFLAGAAASPFALSALTMIPVLSLPALGAGGGLASASAVCAVVIAAAQMPLMLGTLWASRGGMAKERLLKVLDWCFPTIGATLALFAVLL